METLRHAQLLAEDHQRLERIELKRREREERRQRKQQERRESVPVSVPVPVSAVRMLRPSVAPACSVLPYGPEPVMFRPGLACSLLLLRVLTVTGLGSFLVPFELVSIAPMTLFWAH